MTKQLGRVAGLTLCLLAVIYFVDHFTTSRNVQTSVSLRSSFTFMKRTRQWHLDQKKERKGSTSSAQLPMVDVVADTVISNTFSSFATPTNFAATNTNTTNATNMQLSSSVSRTANRVILVTFATALGRRWITLLSLLSIVNAMSQMHQDGYHVELLVSFIGTPSDPAIEKIILSTKFEFKLIVEHVNVTSGQGGFVKSREHLADYFLEHKYTHWMHLDDDMIIGNDGSLSRSMREYLEQDHMHLHHDGGGSGGHIGGGLLVLFLNAWSKPSKPLMYRGKSGIQAIQYVGAPAFIIDRISIDQIGGNPYSSCRKKRKKGCPDGEAANKWFWDKLKAKRMYLLSNTKRPYSVQHLANSQSLIFGKKPHWEHLWATYRYGIKKGTVVTVHPYLLSQVQHAVKPLSGKKIHSAKVHSKLGHSNDLVSYVYAMNKLKSIGKIKLPLNDIEELRDDLRDVSHVQ